MHLLKILFAGAFLGIAFRLGQIQIIDGPRYWEIAQKQYEEKVLLPAARGHIYDRNGSVLASNTIYSSFGADPIVADDYAWLIAEKFSRVFGKPKKPYIEKLESNKRFVWLERQVQPDLARRLKGQEMPGLVEFSEPKRLYHYQEIGEPLLGFTDVDNNGLSGIELQFEQHLRGRDGYVIMQRDGYGRTRPSVDYLRVEPVNGNHVFLTIDLVYQSVAEDKLKRGVERTKADGGIVILMNPRTGEVLAIAQYPGLNPDDLSAVTQDNQKLRAVTDMFEPGSIFKVVTACAALEDRLVRPEQKFNAEGGTYRVALSDGTTRLIKDTREYVVLTFQQAIEYSSNIVMAKVSDVLGAERLYRKARDFGFGNETGVEYPGEAKGELKRPAQWSGTTLNSVAYGYEVGATPMQMVSAYCVIANKGVLMKPTLVKRIIGESGDVLMEHRTEPVRQVTDPETATLLTEFLEGAVQRGTGVSAQIEGVRIAGKTGTSRKYTGGHYEAGNYTASFVGFFPVDDPQIVCLVMLDNPRASGYTGGETAAPLFKEIAQHIITTGKTILPTNTNGMIEQNTPTGVRVPDVSNLQPAVASKLLKSHGLVAELFGEGIVVRQVPPAGASVERGSSVSLLLNDRKTQSLNKGVSVPNLRGLSVRRALNRLAMEKLEARIQGSGIVVKQIPPAGDQVSLGASIVLLCEPSRQVGTERSNESARGGSMP